jgi:hypothetical protein
MLIHTYSLHAISTPTELSLYLRNEENGVEANAVLKNNAPLTWFATHQEPQKPSYIAIDLLDAQSVLHGFAATLLNTSDPFSVIMEKTLLFVEKTLAEGFEGAYVEMNGLTFELHAKSKTRIARTGAPRPKTRANQTRIWI